MKQIVILILGVFFIKTPLFSQNNPMCYYTPDWDWTDETPSNWTAYIDGSNQTFLGTAFGNQPNNIDIYLITQAKDYLPSQGWVLLAKHFGCSGLPIQGGYPWFILYNKFKSTLRVFIWANRPISTQKGLIEAGWVNPGKNTSLFTLYNDFALPNSEYPRTTPENPANIVDDYFPVQSWFMAEYTVNFDHQTSNQKNSYDLFFKLYNAITSSVEYEGDLEFSTESKGVTEAKKTNEGGNKLKWVTDTKKALSKIPSEGDLKKSFGKIYNDAKKFDEQVCNEFSLKVNNAIEEVNNGKFKKMVLGGVSLAGSGIGALGLIMDVAGIFIGKGNKEATSSTTFQPTMSSGTLKLKGTIKTEYSENQILLQLPGTKHISNTGIPIYDCPLGVISLEEIPKIGKQLKYINYGYTFCSGSNNIPRTSQVESYNLAKELKIALNESSGLEIVNIEAAFVGVVGKSEDNDTVSIYDLFKKEYNKGCPTSFKSNSQNVGDYQIQQSKTESAGHSYYNRYRREFLDNGLYKMDIVDPKGFHTFSTPRISIYNFKNTAFTVPKGTDVYLKIYVDLKPVSHKYDQTPTSYALTYPVPSDLEGSCCGIFPSTYEQLVNLKPQNIIETPPNSPINEGKFEGDYHLSTKGEVDVNPSFSDVVFEANGLITLDHGFTANPSFSNYGFYTNIKKEGHVNGENGMILTKYFGQCNSKFKPEIVLENKKLLKKQGFILFPNPSPGNFIAALKFASKEESITLKIFDLMGREIFKLQDNNVLEKTYEIDLSNESAGTYLVSVITSKGIEREKVTIRK